MTKPRIYSDKERKERRAILTRNSGKYLYTPILKTSYIGYPPYQKKMFEEDPEMQELFNQKIELYNKMIACQNKHKTICKNKKECVSEMKKNYDAWKNINKKISIRRDQILSATKKITLNQHTT